jgi:hypothetical protein
MTEDKFLEFWKTIQWPEITPVHYRLYYDDAGQLLFYSQEDLPGKYIDVTPEQFALQDWSVKIVNGKIICQRTTRMTKLSPAESGTLCHPTDVAVVVADHPGQYWKKTENVVKTS